VTYEGQSLSLIVVLSNRTHVISWFVVCRHCAFLQHFPDKPITSCLAYMPTSDIEMYCIHCVTTDNTIATYDTMLITHMCILANLCDIVRDISKSTSLQHQHSIAHPSRLINPCDCARQTRSLTAVPAVHRGILHPSQLLLFCADA